MAKPICKAEAKWKYWRSENPKEHQDRFIPWVKRMMSRARRRHLKQIEVD